MLKKRKNKILKAPLLLMMLALLSLNGCSDKNEIEPEEVLNLPKNATAGAIQETLDSEPVSTENNKETGISADNYDSYEFAGYDGQISFFYTEAETLLYYKWYVTEASEKKADTIYKDVCSALTGSYGDGEEKNSTGSNVYTTSWDTGREQITAQKMLGSSGYEISYTVVNK